MKSTVAPWLLIFLLNLRCYRKYYFLSLTRCDSQVDAFFSNAMYEKYS